MSGIFSPGRMCAALVLTVVAQASAASAQLALQRDATGALTCAALPPCRTNVDCAMRPGTECSAVALPDGAMVPGGRFCVAPESVRYCCAAPVDCPVRTGATAVCVRPADVTVDTGLCIYSDDAFTRCDRASGLMRTEAEVLRDCFTAPPESMSPFGTAPFLRGDCDRDGLPNGADPCPCNPADTCARADGGLPEGDAGMSIDDDAGTTPDDDAGITPDDDAGPSAVVEGGVRDVDASTTRGPDFRGGGGCACRAVPAVAPTHAPLAALFAGLVVLLRARRRRAR